MQRHPAAAPAACSARLSFDAETEVMAMTGLIVLAADDPAVLASFYGALLDVEPQPG